jgi:MFS family permease
VGLISSIYLSGCCIGALIFSCFAFRFGRKELFNVTLAVYFCSVIGAAVSPNYAIFVVCRFFTGVGVGGEYTAIFTAVDELVPSYVRGRVDIILDGTWYIA